jgi:type I restriction enzyme R subunit
MRFNAIPKASYLGFTGTPIIKEEEELTKNIFGDYVSIYDFKRAIDDGATLKLLYNNRGEKLVLKTQGLMKRWPKFYQTGTLMKTNEESLSIYSRKIMQYLQQNHGLMQLRKTLFGILMKEVIRVRLCS